MGFITALMWSHTVTERPGARCRTRFLLPQARRAAVRLQPRCSNRPASWRALYGKASAAGSSAPNVTPVEERKRRGFIQHKREAYWFYRFLSIVYDAVVNPFHWTVEMRDTSLQQAGLEAGTGQSPETFSVVDVGGGTGFCTEGVVKYVAPACVTLLDQSPHQMQVARRKPTLQGVKLVQGDAEALPFATDSFDRYVSAGSIEYWPEPQRGVAEAYRVLKRGGMATIIGPVRATNPFSRFWCDLWMLFPTEAEYRQWFAQAGFRDVRVSYIGPRAYKGIRQHGLIMGLTVTGTKPEAGEPKIQLGPIEEVLDSKRPMGLRERVVFAFRWLLGCIAGFYYFLLPFAIMLYAALFIRQPQASRR